MILVGEARVLVIDDDPSMVPLVEGLLPKGVSIIGARTLQKGKSLAADHRFDVILLDQLLPDGAGLECIEALLSNDRLRPILFVTAQSDASTAIEATRKGAFDYLPKPLDFSFLQQRLLEALEYRELMRTPVVLDDPMNPSQEILVGRCRLMQEVYKSIGRLAAIRNAVLIEGEPGTGKELVARTIHQYGEFRSFPIEKHMANDIDSLIAELSNPKPIDHKEGQHRTILVEDIEHLSLANQSRILQLLRDETESSPRRTRWFFTTSTSTRHLLDRGVLRSDFFYLLSSTLIALPPLRRRDGDLELLVSHFLQKASQIRSTQDGHTPRVSPEAMHLLREYSWPGNVAELKSVLDRVLLESRGVIQANDALRGLLSDLRTNDTPSHAKDRHGLESPNSDSAASASNTPLKSFDLLAYAKEQLKDRQVSSLYDLCIEKLELTLLPLVLHHTSGNRAAAARILGMTRTSLRKKMLTLGLIADESMDDPEAGPEATSESGAGV
ncbi:Nitrogen assimilation regulatory protein [Pirellula sp. SH-Sr6A]|nr:Nitrogen assimilation regulatory protein [Pirellula sp. SH-Sr6A]